MNGDAEPESQGFGVRAQRVSFLSDLAALTKARLSLMVVFTTSAGFCVGSGGGWLSMRHIFAVLGTSLAAASAAALNQLMEVDVDQLMSRTSTRPLPSGRMARSMALGLGVILGLAGVLVLWGTCNLQSAGLALATILIYLFAYTPLKRKSPWCTLIGAVSGAIPPVIGWAASGSGEIWAVGVLFGILFLWQIPHFLAIAWMYRDEYAGAGFVMLKPGDVHGTFTATQSLGFALALAAVSLMPSVLGKVGLFYTVGVSLVNLGFCGSAALFLMDRSRAVARSLFFASIAYLPVVLILLVLSKKA